MSAAEFPLSDLQHDGFVIVDSNPYSAEPTLEAEFQTALFHIRAWKEPSQEQVETAIAFLLMLKQKHDTALAANPTATLRLQLDRRLVAVSSLLTKWQEKDRAFLKSSVQDHFFRCALRVEQLSRVTLTTLKRDLQQLGVVKVLIEGEEKRTIPDLFARVLALLGIDDETRIAERASLMMQEEDLPEWVGGDSRDLQILSSCSSPYFDLLPKALSHCMAHANPDSQALLALNPIQEYKKREISIHKNSNNEIIAEIQAEIPLQPKTSHTPIAIVVATLTSTFTKFCGLSKVECHFRPLPNKTCTLGHLKGLKEIFPYLVRID